MPSCELVNEQSLPLKCPKILMKDTKRSRGRPWVYNLETVKSIAASIAEGASKKEACEKAGVAYSPFMRPYPEGLFIGTKGGVVKKSPNERYLDGSPDGLRRDCEESLKNLRVDCIDLYQLHWVDPNVPLSESVLGLARLQQEGKIKLIGLSNITVKQLEEARSVAEIASVQNRYSVGECQEEPMVVYCAREGIAFVPYGPLGADPMKHGAPLASAEGGLADIGKHLGATSTQVALSWLLHRAPNILPIPGTTSIAHLEENVVAAQLDLTRDQLQQLASASVREGMSP
jgi:pyridoxine 4-dehydrogenase